jgi:imidazolonepropionase-like amidohydrolase
MTRSRALFSSVSLAALTIAANGAQPPASRAGGSLVISGGTLIDGTGKAPLENAFVVIRDGAIADVGTGTRASAGTNADTVDARGRFIVPGFVDSHIHYRDWETELFLAHGVTSVNDLGNPYHWQTALKRGFNDGRMPGPRFFYGGEVVLPSEEAAQNQRPAIVRRGLDVIHKAGDAPRIVKRLRDGGADSLKLNEQFDAEFFSAIARAGDQAGLRVISHSLNVTDSIRWGIRGVEHMEGVAVATARGPRARQAVAGMKLEAGHKNTPLYQWMEPESFDAVIRDLIEHQVFLNPTLTFEWKAITDRSRDFEQEDQRLYGLPALSYVPLDDRLVILGQYHWADTRSPDELRQYKDGYRKVQQFLARFVRAGGKIYAGTDSSAATTPGLSMHHEMQLLVDAGLTPMQALMAATSWGAEIAGQARSLGTIERGKLGDLVLLDANPLQDIANTKKIATVIKDGRVVDRAYHADYEIAITRPGPESKHLYNPVPVLSDVVPPLSVEAAAATLRLVGRGFTPASVARLDGRAVETRFVSPTELTAALTPQQTARVGTFLITVDTPKPGGGLSQPVEFMIVFKER